MQLCTGGELLFSLICYYMEIRKLESNDIRKVVELWYEASVKAHYFISPTYWEKNKEAMATEVQLQRVYYLKKPITKK